MYIILVLGDLLTDLFVLLLTDLLMLLLTDLFVLLLTDLLVLLLTDLLVRVFVLEFALTTRTHLKTPDLAG
jgi:hypothetical protein